MGEPKDLFAGRHFDREIIVLCVRWYLRYKLSLGDLVEIMAERAMCLAWSPQLPSVQPIQAPCGMLGVATALSGWPSGVC
jgi:hypothetical protein